ncbi:hypothetical protein L6452_10109 [Arctium lappa]|uniref:Uncharacterized protein n=1 Tax=Arctium lappa TaxID=4217 RepID=A0ACB9DM98_ARCLA|nr:hypothetical protein L6452_10109 [Arctium lappa]
MLLYTNDIWGVRGNQKAKGRKEKIKKNMKQVEKSWFSWRVAGLMVVVVFIYMAEPVTSQSNDRNGTLIRDYCSLYRGMSEKYFLSNLNATLSNLRHQLSVNGVHYAVARTLFNGEPVWGSASCRGYVSKANCVACFDYAVTYLKKCGLGNGALAYYNDCDLRYETYDFYKEEYIWADKDHKVIICGNTTSPQPSDFRKTAEGLLSDLRTAVPRASNFYVVSSLRIANGNGTIYALMQCNLNLSQSVCEDCVNARYGALDACLPRTTGWAISNGCFTRYSTTPFFGQNQTTNIMPLLWDDKTQVSKDIKNLIKGHAGALGGGVGLFFLLLIFWLFYRLRKKSKKTKEEMKGTVNYDYKHLQLATNNFSEENIIGKGGFGEVFKAILDDKKVVAVKKLKVRYARAKLEFENEVLLTSHIHHRNLLRLLGCSSDVSNLLLVLEYMPNGSLDKFLWGTKKGTLNWRQRYDIIFGIARGLAHLHKEFHAKIIHRDIKSSNILLDKDFQPKIADFGLARFQPKDQTHVITKFGGTLGYIAPEYALHGHLSEKVDTFSFGIVILEIISGRKCTDISFVTPSTDYLLEHAWKLYENNEHMKLIDETMDANQYEVEHVMKIIEIALLCTQSPYSRRPTMAEVVSILPNGQAMGKREIIRPIFIDLNRRIHIDASMNSMGIGNVQLHSEKADDEGDIMEKGMNGIKNR